MTFQGGDTCGGYSLCKNIGTYTISAHWPNNSVCGGSLEIGGGSVNLTAGSQNYVGTVGLYFTTAGSGSTNLYLPPGTITNSGSYQVAPSWILGTTEFNGPVYFTNTSSTSQHYLMLVTLPSGIELNYDGGILAAGAGTSMNYVGPTTGTGPVIYDSPGSTAAIGFDTPIEQTPDQIDGANVVTNWVPVGTPPGTTVNPTATAPASTNLANNITSIGQQSSNQQLTNNTTGQQGIITAINNISGSVGSGTNTTATTWTNGLTLAQLESLLNTNVVNIESNYTLASNAAIIAQAGAISQWGTAMSNFHGMTNIDNSLLSSATNFDDSFSDTPGSFMTITLPSAFANVNNLSEGMTSITYDVNIRHNDYYYWGTFICRGLVVLWLTWRFALTLYDRIFRKMQLAWVVPQAQGQSRLQGGFQPLGIGAGASTTTPAALSAALLITYAIFALPVVLAGVVNLVDGVPIFTTITQSPGNVIIAAANVATGGLGGRHPELANLALWSVKCMDDIIPLFFISTMVVTVLFLTFTLDNVYMGVCALIKSTVPIIVIGFTLSALTVKATLVNIHNVSTVPVTILNQYYPSGPLMGIQTYTVDLPNGQAVTVDCNGGIEVSYSGTTPGYFYVNTNINYVDYWLIGSSSELDYFTNNNITYGVSDPETLAFNNRETLAAQNFNWGLPFGLGISTGSYLAFILIIIKIYRKFGKSIITGTSD